MSRIGNRPASYTPVGPLQAVRLASTLGLRAEVVSTALL